MSDKTSCPLFLNICDINIKNIYTCISEKYLQSKYNGTSIVKYNHEQSFLDPFNEEWMEDEFIIKGCKIFPPEGIQNVFGLLQLSGILSSVDNTEHNEFMVIMDEIVKRCYDDDKFPITNPIVGRLSTVEDLTSRVDFRFFFREGETHITKLYDINGDKIEVEKLQNVPIEFIPTFQIVRVVRSGSHKSF